MIMGNSIVDVKYYKTNCRLTSIYRHNTRKSNPKESDINRRHLNEELIDKYKGKSYLEIFNEIYNSLDYYKTHTFKDDWVKMISFVFNYRIISGDKKEFDFENWKKESLNWLYEKVGKENVVSAIVHLDEMNPHIHAMVVPVVDGRISKQKLLNIGYRSEDFKNYFKSYEERMEQFGLYGGVDNSFIRGFNIEDYRKLKNSIEVDNLPQIEENENITDYYNRINDFFHNWRFSTTTQIAKSELNMINLKRDLSELRHELDRYKKHLEIEPEIELKL